MGVFDIQGLNCVFQVKIGDDYKTVVCAKSFTFNPITDMKETTTVGSGFWKEFRPRKLSYTITFNGMLQVESLASQEVAKTLLTRQTQFLAFEYQLIYEDNSGNVMIVRGSAYVTSSLFDASPVNLVNATHELQGTGPIELLDQLPVPININIVSTGDISIGAFIQFKLIDSNGEVIFDSGHLPEASGGNLSHPVNVTGQVQSGSYYFLWVVTADSVGNVFDLDAPPTKTTAFNDATQSENSFGVQIYDFTADRTATFALGISTPPPTCVAPGHTGLNNTGGTTGTFYTGTVTLTGSQPFTLSNITKPSWLTLSLTDNIVTLSGMPTAGLNQDVSFDMTNACGTASFADQIDISSSPTANTINYTYDEDGTFQGSSCSFKIFVNATVQAFLTVDGSSVIFTNPGDTVEVQISGVSGARKHIDIQDSVSGEIYNADVTTVVHSYVFVTTLGHDYTINGEGGNP